MDGDMSDIVIVADIGIADIEVLDLHQYFVVLAHHPCGSHEWLARAESGQLRCSQQVTCLSGCTLQPRGLNEVMDGDMSDIVIVADIGIADIEVLDIVISTVVSIAIVPVDI
jgi:hypothetical protein